MNVLIYSGPGACAKSVKNSINILKRHIGDSYTVIEINAKALAEEPWQPSTSLLVLPGGRELPYTKDLAGRANVNIFNYVANGGRYLGFCAGSYYASGRCEFELGTTNELIGDRPLKFFPGICRGAAFKGFQYESELGARATPLTFMVPSNTQDAFNIEKCIMYYNGSGGSFIEAEQYTNIKVLATYDEPTSTGSQSAAVLCSVGDRGGKAILSAIHPEYESSSVDSSLQEQLLSFKQKTNDIFRGWLQLLGLKINKEATEAPELTNIQIIYPEPENLSYIKWSPGAPNSTASLFQRLMAQTQPCSGLFEDSNDQFRLQLLSGDQTCLATTVLDPPSSANTQPILTLIGCHQPRQVSGGTFHPELYFNSLKNIASNSPTYNTLEIPFFGAPLIYCEVVSSTQVILQKNQKFLQTLPQGTAFMACRQVAGKGRGRNAWVSPLGCLQFSFYFQHPQQFSKQETTSVVLIQYLAALAVVEGIRSQPEYQDLSICLKWPNDIYGLDYRELNSDGTPMKRKLGGILVNSSFFNQSFTSIIGIGINTTNSNPTMCVNDLIDQLNQRRAPKPPLPHLSQEEFMALILSRFRIIYAQFLHDSQGLKPFLDRYYSYWLHGHQLVTLADQNGLQARVMGITPDYGLLEVISVDPSTGHINPLNCKRLVLQPDGNSFDMMTGFISKKTSI